MAEREIEPTVLAISRAFDQYAQGRNKGVIISTPDTPNHESRHLVVGDVVQDGDDVVAHTFSGMKKVVKAEVYY